MSDQGPVRNLVRDLIGNIINEISSTNWILATGFWDDTNIWEDGNVWID